METFKEFITEEGTYSALYADDKSAEKLYKWCNKNKIVSQDKSEYHCTLIYSKKRLEYLEKINGMPITVECKIKEWKILGKALTLLIECENVRKLNKLMMNAGATSDFPSYIPHITINPEFGEGDLPKDIPDFNIILNTLVVKKIEKNE